MCKMTLSDIRKIQGPYLMPTDVGKYMRISAQVIRALARKDPDKLPFAVYLVNNWVRIPKGDFIRWAETQE